ncbi:MAG: glycosyltransferase family 2 protein [Microgenomates group bacterium]
MTQDKQTAVIVIPTYNEAGSIGQMIDYLNSKTFPSLDKKWEMKILVVDGNSPDGTGKIVTDKSKKYKNVFLLTETSKDGIGAAYLKGFKYAMEKLAADFVFEFDGDFQHPPEMIPKMLQAIDDGYDYVIGSRKIKGGSNPKGWGFKRTFLSEAGSLVARIILFFPFKNFFHVTDPTTGLKVTRVRGFADHLNLNFNHLYTKSFGYKFQLLFETLALGARFKEVPLVFNVRTTGESKIERQATIEMLMTTLKIRWFDDFTQKFLKFGTVGFVGYLFNAFGLVLFAKITTIEWLIWLLATEVAIISNFTLNNVWTFSSQKITDTSLFIKKFFQFNLSSVGAIIIQAVVGSIGVTVFGLSRQILLPLIILFLVLPYNWLMYNTFIWKKK